MTEIVYAVAGGSDLFVFDDRDAAGMQSTVMIGANLDVETYNLPADTWDRIRADLIADPELNVVEVFTSEPEHPDATAMRRDAGQHTL